MAALAESTLRSKRLRGYPDTIGVATGEMLSQKELEGTPAVSPVDNTVTLTYGTKETTRQKMERFTRGRRRRGTQPPRPGYELDATIEADLNRLIVDVIERRLSHLGGA